MSPFYVASLYCEFRPYKSGSPLLYEIWETCGFGGVENGVGSGDGDGLFWYKLLPDYNSPIFLEFQYILQDINECAPSYPKYCQQICNNTLGGCHCLCSNGWKATGMYNCTKTTSGKKSRIVLAIATGS
ncbi:hypothetical protein POM88_043763 [Heracleum sosnowskyi]|uniref:EGF-like calcium-binding domain-containing protein n=1 Tax=Heracleum sosnowskyi TaxID=360622 RepID=A0AAD8GW52_9APIA|nr:hypothetical protein POM88_048972 [Heracleum sosnowskyi]KAK1359289.1 hypothetical protein POM88_043763 [Heracleum sosnowskyi]